MKKSKSNKLVPELRFQEFHGSGAWVAKELNELAKRVIKKNKKSLITRVLTNSAEYGIVDQREFFEKDIANPNNLEGYLIVDEGDYVYNSRVSKVAPVGPISKNNIAKGVMSPLYTVFRFFEQRNTFYEHYFKTSHWHRYLKDISNTGARHDRMSISSDGIDKMPLPEPPEFAEQKKIAGCLSSIDNLITAHTQKLEALKVHKKGLVQKLFPLEGKTLPRLRFPEFEGDKNWEEKKFGDLTDFASGGTPSRDRADYWGGNIPWISAASMHETKIKKSDRHITLLAVDEGARLAPAGTILLLVRGSMLHKRIPVGITECEVAFNQDVKALNLKKRVLEQFLLYLLISSESILLSAVTKTGIGAGKLDTNDLKDFVVSIPPSFQEQQKIADCLSSMDNQITVQTKKLRSLKSHKKGLMQKLFPSIDEIQL